MSIKKYCFDCMEPIKGKNYVTVRVREEFCHSSYWQTEHGKQYGKLEDDGKFGILYIHKKCDASEDYSTVLGEGYEYCEGCNTEFNSDDLSMAIYEKSDEILCAVCATEFVKENLSEFLNSGLPNFDKTIRSVNLNAQDLDGIPNLRHCPEDNQGWCSSVDPVGTTDEGHGTFKEAIEAIVARGNKWLVITGGPNVTHNICSVAVDVYEYSEHGFKA